ncbi:DcrB-related protein [Nissabacter sp. SGAir0207]|uniref:DcrB-related protein n=1 Tax=Nissabacter sp. SGAir0207 TaxID=2126321 RepID=UPI0010F637BF|nr:DcrB-related protein [Nissabacter sp. SGAir0207]
MKPIVKYGLAALMLTSLTACDNAAEKPAADKAAPAATAAPAEKAAADAKAAPAQAAPASNAAQPAAEAAKPAAQPRLSFTLPKGFVDRSPTPKEGDRVLTRVFANPTTHQMVTLINYGGLTPLADREVLKKTLEENGPKLLETFKKQYSSVNVLKKGMVTLSGHPFFQFESKIKQQDRAAISTSLTTQQNAQMINIQIMTVSDDLAAHEALVKAISDNIAFK